jgi:hypothetical protein
MAGGCRFLDRKRQVMVKGIGIGKAGGKGVSIGERVERDGLEGEGKFLKG